MRIGYQRLTIGRFRSIRLRYYQPLLFVNVLEVTSTPNKEVLLLVNMEENQTDSSYTAGMQPYRISY